MFNLFVKSLAKKMNLDKFESQLEIQKQEINLIKTHILNFENTWKLFDKNSNSTKISKLSNRISEIENWNSRIYEIMDKNKKNIEEYFEIFGDRLDYLENKLINSVKTQYLPEDQSTDQKLHLGITSRPTRSTNRPAKLDWSTDQISTGKNLWEITSEAEKEIIKELYDSGYPMSYYELSNKLNKSPSTIKNHINNLKLKGFQFNETTGLNNTKKYSSDERVKLFLTMRLNN